MQEDIPVPGMPQQSRQFSPARCKLRAVVGRQKGREKSQGTTQAAQGKQGVRDAIDRIRQSEEILNQTLDAEAKAHQTAAQSALTARDQIQQTLTQTENQIDQTTAKLKDGLKVTLDADTTRFDKAIADLDKALAEKEYLLKIQADLQEAEKKLQQYEQLLKEGKTLPVDTVVVCAGQEPCRELFEPLQAAGIPVTLIGGADLAAELDAKRAIDQGTRVAAAL